MIAHDALECPTKQSHFHVLGSQRLQMVCDKCKEALCMYLHTAWFIIQLL